MAKRVVLAYSGGLDTSVAIAWLREELGAEVVALAVDVGQREDFGAIQARARQAGAVDVEVVDAKDEMAERFVVPAIAANALYEGRYPLVSALSRPVIVRHLVEAARRHRADAVAHGCTAKGNDQLRFELGLRALAPDIEVLAPARAWRMTRPEALAYAKARGIEVDASAERIYSIDENLWGRAIEAGILEDPWVAPPEDAFVLTRPYATEARELVIGFDAGVPVSVDGERLRVLDVVRRVGEAVGAYGWGRIDMVENRTVGIKSREVYECPAALAVLLAHRDLEGLTLERSLAHLKARLEPEWAELVYEGFWYSPLKEALDAFFARCQEDVTGEVRLRLRPGSCEVVGRRSPVGLYDVGLATYAAGDAFDHADAAGFVRLTGQSVATWAARRQGGRA
jgi:argininosuccinate synthase